jgi:cyclopropane fatty-acyl-phospholipid synthase-like methyltransferase
MNEKPYSQACEDNKNSILAVLKTAFANTQQVLEIGSGSGQHAVYFASNLPHLQWQTSDLKINHRGINQWVDAYPCVNLIRPVNLDLQQPWPISTVEGIYTANTLHIISWPLVEKFFAGVKKCLANHGRLCIYGPFNYHGKFTSDSNADFNVWLKNRDEKSGIRDFEAILTLAQAADLTLVKDHTMPANNRLLEFVKSQ